MKFSIHLFRRVFVMVQTCMSCPGPLLLLALVIRQRDPGQTLSCHFVLLNAALILFKFRTCVCLSYLAYLRYSDATKSFPVLIGPCERSFRSLARLRIRELVMCEERYQIAPLQVLFFNRYNFYTHWAHSADDKMIFSCLFSQNSF